MEADAREEIAIIGMACRFPGDANSPEKLWDMLANGSSAWSEFPKNRLNIDGYYHPSGNRQGSIPFRGAHFINGDVAAFDAPFFSISPEEAKSMDPQQRLLLEVSYEALESAGIRLEDVDGSDASVFVGSFVKDYEQVCLRDQDYMPQYAATGNGNAILSNRISHFYNLHGPSMTIDTGCSGSLVAVHLAVQSLMNKECSLAIAAGVGIILTPSTMMPMTALNFLSPDGKCWTFDHRANGYGRGEGVGVVVMRRLSDAISKDDTIRAIIRATKVNQDGHTPGITLPSKEAQVSNIQAAYKLAGLEYDQTGYVECHGTGTQAGDFRELKAISETLSSVRSSENPLIVGSIKPNVGHLEGAAGIAGLIKGILVLEKGTIPPNINFEKQGENIDLKSWKLKVPTELTAWPLAGMRRVSVNCFGFGGTNAHLIMEEAPGHLAKRNTRGNHVTWKENQHFLQAANANSSIASAPYEAPPTADFEPQLFVYSSNEKAGLRRIIDSHIPYLHSKSHLESRDFFNRYAYTLGCRRSHLEWSGFVVVSSTTALAGALETLSEQQFHQMARSDAPRLGFTFAGQGSEWAGMGLELMIFPTFRHSLQAASSHLNSLDCTFNLLQEITKPSEISQINAPEISQPAVTALQIAMVDLLADFGIRPKAVVGHSSGEIAAAYASGALSQVESWEIAFFRGQAAASMKIKRPGVHGAMLAARLAEMDAQRYLEDMQSPVEVACINSPQWVTLSGNASDILKIRDDLNRRGIFHRLLSVPVAYHSSHMTLVELEYREMLAGLGQRDRQADVPMFSSVIGQAIPPNELGIEYWVSNMLSPVRFMDAVSAMMEDGGERPDLLIEVSPGASMRTHVTDILNHMVSKSATSYFPMIDRRLHAIQSVLKMVGELWARGYPVEMNKVITKSDYLYPKTLLSDMPPYPWNHERSYWHESHMGLEGRFRRHARQDLIGSLVVDSVPYEPQWRGFLRIGENPWLQDHQVQKTTVFPAMGMVTMAIEAAIQIGESEESIVGFEVSNVRIEKAMIIPHTDHGLEVLLSAKERNSTEKASKGPKMDFVIYSKALGNSWDRNATGTWSALREHISVAPELAVGRETYIELEKQCTESVSPRALYELIDVVGINYGKSFQNVRSVSMAGNSCVSQVRVADTKSRMPGKFEYPHLIHPATLDSMTHPLLSIDGRAMVPSFIESVYVSADICRASDTIFSGYGVAKRDGIRGVVADVVMSDSKFSRISVSITGFHCTALSEISTGIRSFLPNNHCLCSELVWEKYESTAQWTGVNWQRFKSVLILVPEMGDCLTSSLGSTLRETLSVRGVESSFSDLKGALLQSGYETGGELACISLLEADTFQHSVYYWTEDDFHAFHRLTDKIKAVLWVTRVAHMKPANPKSSPIVGLARCLMSEDPQMVFVTLDLDENVDHISGNNQIDADIIVDVFARSILTNSTKVPKETEYAVDDGHLMVSRLLPFQSLNNLIEGIVPETQTTERRFILDDGSTSSVNINWTIHQPSISNDTVVLMEEEIEDIGDNQADEVEIVFHATLLIASKVDASMERSIGGGACLDIHGVIGSIGKNVDAFQPGESVAGISLGNTFRSRVRLDHRLLWKVAPISSFSVANFAPSAYVAAFHGLVTIGRLSQNQSIFIFSAASLFGQAALDLAQAIGLKVFVGIDGTSAERQRSTMLEVYGVPQSHILLTNTTAFVDQVLHLTDGKGVDVVFNPTELSIAESFRISRKHGTIVHLSSHDGERAPVLVPTGVVYANYSVASMLESDIAHTHELLRETYKCLLSSPQINEERSHERTGIKFWGLSEMAGAFRAAQADPNFGLNIIAVESTTAVSVLRKEILTPLTKSIMQNGRYILSGGLGGLGRSIADLLVTKGARDIVFLSRSGETETTRSFLKSLRERGANISAISVDICDTEAVDKVIEKLASDAEMPIVGVIQGATLLRDKIFTTMSYSDWKTAFDVKVIGSTNLVDSLERHMAHPWYIFLSSSSGIIGSRGQANYAAGNVYQDALSRCLRLRGRRAVALDIGPIVGRGQVNDSILDILKNSGFVGVRNQDFLLVLTQTISDLTCRDGDIPAQIVMGVGTGGLCIQNNPLDPYWTRTALYSHLARVGVSQANIGLSREVSSARISLRSELMACEDIESATRVISNGLVKELARSLNIPAEDIDSNKPPNRYGVDSLVAVGARAWLLQQADVDVSVFDILSDRSIIELSRSLAAKRGLVMKAKNSSKS